MAAQAHILVVDDDIDLREVLGDYLREFGYRVSTVHGGVAMRRMLAEGPVDLIILDMVMPGEDGMTLTRDIRVHSDVPIIIMSGKAEQTDRIVGFELGADDFIAKPCDLREVLARVRSAVRRGRITVREEPAALPRARRFSGWVLDFDNRSLTSPGGQGTALTSREFELLALLANSPGQALGRAQLVLELTGKDSSADDRNIDNLVSRLRRKIESNPRDPQIIRTVHGVGYMLAPETT